MTTRGWAAVRLLAFVAAYVVAGVLGRMTIVDGHAMSLAWPAAGVGAVWLATSDRRRLPADLVALALTVLVVNRSTGAPTDLSLLFVVTNVVQAGLFVLLARRLRPDLLCFGGTRTIGSLPDLGGLVGAALVACTTSAAIGMLGLDLLGGAGPASAFSAFLVWAGRNLTGILVVGVLGLLLLERLDGLSDRADLGARLRRVFWPSSRHAVETGVLTLLSATMLWLVFGATEALPVGFLLLFTTVLAGVRLGPVGVVLHGLGLGSGALVFTLAGQGPFAAIRDVPERALVAQVFVTMLIVTGLVLALSRTERNRALADLSELQRATAERAQLFGAVLEHMREGVAVIDAHGEILLRNPAGRRMVGNTDEEASQVARTGDVTVLTHVDGSPLRPDELPFRRALAGEEVLGDYLLTPPGASEPIVLEVTAAPLPCASDDPTCCDGAGGAAYDRAIVSYRDVTALRHDRDALATFAGVVAHDLKRPLTVINGWSEALAESFAEGPVGPEEGTRVLARVSGAAQQMGHFIDDLLSYTVVRDAPVSAVDVDLSKAADESATVFRERESRPQIYVQTGLHATADPVLVRQVLDNLIGNATKYVAPGVRPRVQVRGREDAEETVLTVSDNGIGIPEEQRRRIFETFHRAHVEGYGGTGLGLAIVRRAVERCQGSITVRDNPGGGTVFEVRLPAGTPPVVVDAPTSAPSVVSLPAGMGGAPAPVPGPLGAGPAPVLG